jgi:protein-disulfide isomerase
MTGEGNRFRQGVNRMAFITRAAAIMMLVTLAIVSADSVSSAQSVRGEIETIIKDYLAQHPEEIGDMVKEYLSKHPEVLQQAIIDMVKKREPSNAQALKGSPANLDRSAAIKSNSELLFNSKRQVTLGNAEGDVTLVEFFDYNCGYCKRALSDTVKLIADDPKLKIVLKEFPILGPGSLEAARIGVAVRMQDQGGRKYLNFHEKLLGNRGPANRETALGAAREAGVDMARLETDMASDEVARTLDEDRQLGQSLGINGTPGYVVGNVIVPGAVGAEALRKVIQQARN